MKFIKIIYFYGFMDKLICIPNDDQCTQEQGRDVNVRLAASRIIVGSEVGRYGMMVRDAQSARPQFGF